MSPDAIPFVAAVITMFATFIVGMNGAYIWVNLRPKAQRTSTTGSSMALAWAAE